MLLGAGGRCHNLILARQSEAGEATLPAVCMAGKTLAGPPQPAAEVGHQGRTRLHMPYSRQEAAACRLQLSHQKGSTCSRRLHYLAPCPACCAPLLLGL
jgi:hypothetical protein